MWEVLEKVTEVFWIQLFILSICDPVYKWLSVPWCTLIMLPTSYPNVTVAVITNSSRIILGCSDPSFVVAPIVPAPAILS